jgi:cell wall-associated NlpC family hydrolase
MDRRLTPANGRVAALNLKGKIDAEVFTDGELLQVHAPTTTIWRDACEETPDRELLFGDVFRVLEELDGFAFGQAEKDGYCGYVRAGDLSQVTTSTHFVAVRSTHLYNGPGIKTPRSMALSFASRLTIAEVHEKFAVTTDGHYVPITHIRELGSVFSDPVEVAEIFLGTPYLWGGNSGFGLDCSALVQVSLMACGVPCPGDSDMQERSLGAPLGDAEPTRRGDLFFWKGHVAIAADAERIIHANAHRMSVNYERIDMALPRIEAAGDGPVTSRRRV